jgi:hypothetical protein
MMTITMTTPNDMTFFVERMQILLGIHISYLRMQETTMGETAVARRALCQRQSSNARVAITLRDFTVTRVTKKTMPDVGFGQWCISTILRGIS